MARLLNTKGRVLAGVDCAWIAHLVLSHFASGSLRHARPPEFPFAMYGSIPFGVIFLIALCSRTRKEPHILQASVDALKIWVCADALLLMAISHGGKAGIEESIGSVLVLAASILLLPCLIMVRASVRKRRGWPKPS